MSYLSSSGRDPDNLGYFATPMALEAAYPVGFPGAFAIVGSTDTIWVWDEDTMAWVNSGVSSGTGSIIAATDTGDHQHYTLAQVPTSSSYYAIINNGSYTTDDTEYPFSVSGTTLTFNAALPSDLAASLIKLVCV